MHDDNVRKESKEMVEQKKNNYKAIEEFREQNKMQGLEESVLNENKEKEVKIYKYEEAIESTKQYFNGDELAASVWVAKYALKDSQDNIYELNPEMMHKRIASEVARMEVKYPNPLSEEEVYDLIKDFKYIIPQGSPMAGIGNNFQIASLSNCFVIGNEGASDSYGALLKTDQEQVQLMKRRGGVGHDLSGIRPKGSHVNNSALTSTGIVPFMERFSNSTREVAQDGRRGALMLSISSKHPDAKDFIDAKLEEGKVTGANVSVKIDDEFMKSVINGTKYTQKYPIDSANPKFEQEVDAQEIWDKIIYNAWKSAEPGVLFWDTVINESVPDCYADKGFETVSTNPCGEIPLCPYDSCRLLALNLYSYVEQPFTKDASFNFKLFSQHAAYAQRIMDDIIDLEIEKIDAILQKIESDPEDEAIKFTEKHLWENIKKKCLEGRRTGIGITAEGDMLAAMNLTYCTDDATAFSVKVHKTLAVEVYRSSVNLAKERGAFPLFDYTKELKNPFINRIKEADSKLYEEMKQHGRRNIALLTIAPTGSVSICTQTTSGIEPVFNVTYKRRKKVNPNDKNANVAFTNSEGDAFEEFRVYHHKFLTWAEQNGYSYAKISKLSDKDLELLIETSPYNNATSQDIDWVNKVKMQGAIQKWVDHSISVTVNVPEDTKEDVVDKIYKTAWENGCKGMTIYREGSRDGVLISDNKKDSQNNNFDQSEAPQRPKIIQANIHRFNNNNKSWLAIVGVLDGRPYEIFTGEAEGFVIPSWVEKAEVVKVKTEDGTRYDLEYKDKYGYKVILQGLSRSFNPEYWNYAKLISGTMRHGMPVVNVVNLVDRLELEDHINAWKNGVVRTLKEYVPNGTSSKAKCSQCDGVLIFNDGCLICQDCGYSKCS